MSDEDGFWAGQGKMGQARSAIAPSRGTAISAPSTLQHTL